MTLCDHCGAKGAENVSMRGPFTMNQIMGGGTCPPDVNGDLCQGCQAMLRGLIKDFMHVPSTLNEHA